MAFKKHDVHKEAIELVSLIDMIFILLVFFLVTSFVIRMSQEERGLYMPTPENARGRAQIVLQFIDENQVFWIDEGITDVVSKIENDFGYLSQQRLRDKILEALYEQSIMSFTDVQAKIDALRIQADGNPSAQYFVMIRSPNELPYYRVMDVIARLSDTTYRNIKYGSVGGTLAQIQQCKEISTGVERLADGKQRRIIKIDF